MGSDVSEARARSSARATSATSCWPSRAPCLPSATSASCSTLSWTRAGASPALTRAVCMCWRRRTRTATASPTAGPLAIRRGCRGPWARRAAVTCPRRSAVCRPTRRACHFMLVAERFHPGGLQGVHPAGRTTPSLAGQAVLSGRTDQRADVGQARAAAGSSAHNRSFDRPRSATGPRRC